MAIHAQRRPGRRVIPCLKPKRRPRMDDRNEARGCYWRIQRKTVVEEKRGQAPGFTAAHHAGEPSDHLRPCQ